uniref:Uncharacterized protein n=1 Tax=Panagrolaimus sp. JU765 TaxID=591449 RepID=A0AC34QAB5_9BILA
MAENATDPLMLESIEGVNDNVRSACPIEKNAVFACNFRNPRYFCVCNYANISTVFDDNSTFCDVRIHVPRLKNVVATARIVMPNVTMTDKELEGKFLDVMGEFGGFKKENILIFRKKCVPGKLDQVDYFFIVRPVQFFDVFGDYQRLDTSYFTDNSDLFIQNKLRFIHCKTVDPENYPDQIEGIEDKPFWMPIILLS